MDPVNDRHYIEELRKQAEEDAATRGIVRGLKRKVEEMDLNTIENKNRILKIDDDVSMLRNAAIPFNIKAIHEKDILQWKKDNRVFYESHNFLSFLENVKNQTHVTFVGVPGSGKTATARHIALMLQQEGYEIVPIKDIRKIEDYCDSNNPQVFVIDDVVGVFGLQTTKINLLTDYKDKIMNPVMSKSKTLMTCREAVYRESLGSSSFFTDEDNIVLLHNDANALTNTDKKCLLKIYNIDVDLLSPENLTSASKMFPYLCKLFSNEKKFQLYGPVVFENPIPCILRELDEMRKENKIQYASLVLCMMNENKISGKILKTESGAVVENFHEKKLSVLEQCKVSSHTDDFKFVDALSEMLGTYTKLYDDDYSFVHDSMFEIVVHHFGSKFPESILKFMSSNYIAKNVKVKESLIQKKQNTHVEVTENAVLSGDIENWENNEIKKNAVVESFDLCIRLEEKHYPMLAERLYRDIENMELFDVFMNNILKEPKVYQAFEDVLKTKSDTELESLFLSEQKDVDKVVGEVMRESRRSYEHFSEDIKQRVVLNERWEESIDRFKLIYSVRVISWVIYYGHNRILQYILKQTENKKAGPTLIRNISDKENTENYRLILLGCFSGDVETVKMLLKYINKYSLNKYQPCLISFCSHDYTPLTSACEDGHIRIVEELILAGADVNQHCKDTIPLIETCMQGHMEILKKLIEAGADVNLEYEYDTPLTAACKHGHKSVVKELLAAGADTNLFPRFRRAPLIEACGHGHMDL